jgi:hypothetical protein
MVSLHAGPGLDTFALGQSMEHRSGVAEIVKMDGFEKN